MAGWASESRRSSKLRRLIFIRVSDLDCSGCSGRNTMTHPRDLVDNYLDSLARLISGPSAPLPVLAQLIGLTDVLEPLIIIISTIQNATATSRYVLKLRLRCS
jgi:hypothetical protein